MPKLFRGPGGGLLLGPGGSVVNAVTTLSASTGNEFTNEFSSEFQVGVIAPPDVGVPVTGTLLFSTTLENADTVPTWAKQELSIGQVWKKGDVPPGTSVVAGIDGITIPCQVSNRVFWSDGSLKHAQIRMLVTPSIPVGGTKTIGWYRQNTGWASHDVALHAAPTAVTGKVALEWAFPNWAGRNASNVITAERGPKYLRSAAMLGAGNSQWIDTVMSGPVCSEWRATAMSVNAAGTADANFGGMLYARAWGGTAGNPARIEFLFRSMFGWSDGAIPSDEQGIRTTMNLSVNGTVVRGAALGTAGWSARDSYVGGFYASAGPTGKMDWFDVATNSFVTPPALVYRQNMTYGISTNFFPPYDLNNPKYSPAAILAYAPQGRGSLDFQQDNVGAHMNLAWATSAPFAAAMVAHGKRPVAEVLSQSQNCRVTGFGTAAIGGHAFHRSTRKIVCYLPTARNPDPTALGASIFTGAKPSVPTNGAVNPYVQGQDAAHHPQVCWWPYLTEGDQHFLDLVYAEATQPAIFSQPAEGFFTTVPGRNGTVQVGGIVKSGQVRGVGHGIRPVVNAMAVGNPADPHHKLVTAMWNHINEVLPEQIYDQDKWRTSTYPNPDGRHFDAVKTLPFSSNQEPEFKIWMHTFGLFSLSYGYAITENEDVKKWADWWSHTPTVMSGGWHNDGIYLMKPDPAQVAEYYHIACSSGNGATNNDRRPWAYHIQWGGGPMRVAYKADNQTLDWGTQTVGGVVQPCVDGMVVTITGVHTFSEPAEVIDMTKIPGGLVRGQVYYTVQSTATTSKISATLGGAPVTFTSGGADIIGMASRNTVFGAPGHVMRSPASISQDDDGYLIEMLAGLDIYQHYCAPSDARVLLARQKLKALKNGKGGGYDLRGLTTVPL